MKNQRIVSIYAPKEEFDQGNVDVTERLYKIVSKENIEGIKYMVPTSTESGIYFTIVLVEKKEKEKGILGFTG